MTTNYEHYQKQIVPLIGGIGRTFKGELKFCSDLKCNDCTFFKKVKECDQVRKEWLLSNYIKKYNLSIKDKGFALYKQSGFLARDKDTGSINWFSEKPELSSDGKWWHCGGKNIKVEELPSIMFLGVTPDEPVSIETILEQI